MKLTDLYMGHACSFKLLYYWVYCMRWNVIAKTSKSTPCDQDFFFTFSHLLQIFFFTFTTPSFIHILYTIHHSIRTSLFYLYTTLHSHSPCFVAVEIDRSRNFFTFDQSGMFIRSNVRPSVDPYFVLFGEIGKVSLSKRQIKHIH